MTAANQQRGASHGAFPKISDYGLIGDGRTAALVSRFGAIEWLCLPHFDSKSFFGALLDRDRGGTFRISPVHEFDAGQSYLDDTNILVTEFSTDTGRAKLTDCFSVAAETEKANRLWPNHEIVRQLEVTEGELEFEAEFAPRVGFTQRIRLEMRGRGICVAASGRKVLFLQSSLEPACWRLEGKRYTCRFRLRAGERAVFSLAYADSAPAVIPALATVGERYALTENYWKSWISQCTYEGNYAREVRRSALALKLLLFAPSGAIVAAPTASLPERIGGNRNWDYRYCWLRDAAFTTLALVHLGYHAEAQAFTSWMLHATRLTWPRLQVLYSVFGNARIRERTLEVAGYRDSQPVRIGNAAYDQFQLDVYGEVLGSLTLALDGVKQVDGEVKRFIIGLGHVVCREWNEPDDGIWEVRSGRKQHTHSKLLAWLALESLIKLCHTHRWDAPLAEFSATKEKIRHAIEAFGYNPELGAYTRTFGGDELDASLLIMPLIGYCAPDHPRMQSTLKAIGQHLAVEDLVYRYRGTDDGVGGDEGAFGICSFWYISCLAQAGERSRARALFERFLGRHNGAHLWPEEIDPANGEFLGNYPQAFSHVGLINCAVRLAQKEAA